MNRQNQIATKQVMLICDEFSSPVSLLVLLATEGYEVILARNEQQVQDELVNGSKPDLILFELQLNAIGIFRIIQSTQPQVPVIVMAEPGLLSLALEVREGFGVREVVRKPLDFSLLKELVQRTIEKSPLMS
jgi:DNA-binding NtrC family response regulator